MNNLTTAPFSRRSMLAGAGVLAVGGGALVESLLLPRPAYAAPSDEKRAEANAVLVELQALQADLDIKSNAYNEALAEEQEAEAKMADALARIDAAQAKIDKLKARLAIRCKSMYVSNNSSFLDILFGSTSFSAFINNLQLLNQMNQNDTDTVAETKVLKAEIEEEEREYERQEKIAEEKRIEAENVKNEAEAVTNQVRALYERLDAEARELLRQEQAAERARQEAERQAALERARQEEEARRRQQEESGQTPAQDPVYYPNTGNAIVDRALSWVGKGRYVWAACSASGAFDCSGFVAYCVTNRYQRIGTTWTFINNNYGWFPRVADPQPGDICVVHNATHQHTGIYYGNGMMIHAADEIQGIIVGPVSYGMVFCRYCGPVY